MPTSVAQRRIPAWRLAAFGSIAFPSAGLILALAIFLPHCYTRTQGQREQAELRARSAVRDAAP